MGNHVEKLKKRALEISETKDELKEQKKINVGDLSIVDELFSIPLEDDSAVSEIRSLSKAITTEQSQIEDKIEENKDDIEETSEDTDDFIKGLRDNVRRLEQMEKASDLVNVGQQIQKTESRIDELEEVKRILETDSHAVSHVQDSYGAIQVDKGKIEETEPSALSNILTAGAAGVTSPSYVANAAAFRAPPGAKEPLAQAIQATVNMGVVASEELMRGTIRQHGRSPASELESMQIQKAIEDGAKAFGRTSLLDESLKEEKSFNPPDTIYNDLVFYNKPNVQSPRILNSTQQGWQSNNGSEIFNAPLETGRILDSRQGKVEGFRGTCGLVSCVNLLRLANVDISEADIVYYASTHQNSTTGDDLCTILKSPDNNGGTTYSDRQEILRHFGLQSTIQEATIDNIADAVINGKGVILSVDAGELYGEKRLKGCLHAIAVTSVQMRNGLVEGFFICDSGTGGRDGAKYYTVEEVKRAVKGRKINVTSNIIR